MSYAQFTNSTQRSEHKKDPGIPNNFPYKDQILAEVAEQRRQVFLSYDRLPFLFINGLVPQAEEEKQKRKEEKRAAKTVEEADGDADDGIASLAARHLFKATAAKKRPEPELVEEESDEDESPLLVSPDLPDLKSALECADVVVSLLDARDPLAYRSSFLESWVSDKPGKRLLFILNKLGTHLGLHCSSDANSRHRRLSS